MADEQARASGNPDSGRSETEEYDAAVYMEKLKSLKELSRLQSRCRRVESQVERWYSEGEECRVLVRECQCEVEKLKSERQRLLDRIRVIDQDVQMLSDLTESLKNEQRLRLLAAPLSEYNKLRQQVNSSHQALGLPPLPESQAAVSARELKAKGEGRHRQPVKQLSKTSQKESASSSSCLEKAGPSRKTCPHCFKLVSRNAVVCPHCTAHCSRKRRRKKITVENCLSPDSRPP